YSGISSPRTIATPSSDGGASGSRLTAGESTTSRTLAKATPNCSAPTRKTRTRSAPSRNMAYLLDQLGDGAGDVRKRGHAVRPGEMQRGLWHAVDGRRGTVLDHGAPSGRTHQARPFGTVAAHSREHDGDRRRPED